jgi:iturin family lipopeptide synthetase B
LYAYVAAKEGKDIDVSELRNSLSGVLPSYMVPSYIVTLEKIPLTPSGKVDRKALPEPNVGGRGEDYAAPRNSVEVKLEELWSGVLGLQKERIGIDANFFELGGNSLKAAQLTAHIHRTFQVILSLGEIFKTPTIRGAALTISKTGETPFFDIETVEEKEFYQVSYNQRRLWIISQLEPDTAAYNMPESIAMKHNVDEEALKKAIYKIIERHESLRTGFKTMNKTPVQFVLPPQQVVVPFKRIDISSLDGKKRNHRLGRILAGESQTPFHLTQAPLLRFVLVKVAEEEYYMAFNMHHIISDGLSIEIMKKEFSYLYEGYRRGETAALEPIKSQYKDFTEWQNKQLKNPAVKEQSHRFWKKILEGDKRSIKSIGQIQPYQFVYRGVIAVQYIALPDFRAEGYRIGAARFRPGPYFAAKYRGFLCQYRCTGYSCRR